MKWYFLKSIFTGALFLSASAAQAQLAIIVNPSNPIGVLSMEETRDIYLGKKNHFPNGEVAIPVDQSEESIDRHSFYKKVIKKEAGQIKAYWAKLVFANRGTPPEVIGTAPEVKAWVASHKEAIGYIDDSLLDLSVKLVSMVP